MSKLQITVFTSASEVAHGVPIQEEWIDYTSSSVQSNAIAGSSRAQRRVRIFSDADCFVTWGANPTATTDGTSGRMMGAENPEYFSIEAGMKVAVIQRV